MPSLGGRVSWAYAKIWWLLVGPRPDSTVQDRNARAVLAEVAPALGRALQVIAARRRRFAAFFPEGAPAAPPRRAVRSRSQPKPT